tara:strand:- start:123 stop:497 length:375 start_codon:yes stop_codon:yes gene_type:complete
MAKYVHKAKWVSSTGSLSTIYTQAGAVYHDDLDYALVNMNSLLNNMGTTYDHPSEHPTTNIELVQSSHPERFLVVELHIIDSGVFGNDTPVLIDENFFVVDLIRTIENYWQDSATFNIQIEDRV